MAIDENRLGAMDAAAGAVAVAAAEASDSGTWRSDAEGIIASKK
jgi:hypothetical protein